jgi:hypothetical protein
VPSTPGGEKRLWTGISEESFWCEITDRVDIGTDLRVPSRRTRWFLLVICANSRNLAR